jgi:dienelactone hydrolase
MRRNAAATWPRILSATLAAIAAVAFVYATATLWRNGAGVRREAFSIGEIPATAFHPAAAADPKAIVVVAHGFAGSQQMMASIATTLAQDGYLAVTFDFAGHGRNPAPLTGGIADLAASTRLLLAEIDRVVSYVKALPDYHGRLALVGHSMASELVVQSAMARDDVDAVVALSLFGREVTAKSPRNLEVIDGAWEFSVLKQAARRIVGLTSENPQEGVTYGSFADGTARSYRYARGAEHIGVIYSLDALEATRAWLDAAFGARPLAADVDRRGPSLGIMLLAVAVLLRLSVEALPRLSPAPPAAPLSSRRLWALIAMASLVTPLALWKASTNFLPILLGDYLAVHFAAWGVCLWAGLALLAPKGTLRFEAPALARAFVCGLVLAGLYLLLIGAPLDAWVTSFWPVGRRWALIPIEFAAVALAFTAEERLARGQGAPRLAYFLLKLGFVVSLVAAIALNPQRLFFLAIVAPVVAILFTGFGFINRGAFKRTHAPAVAAFGSALALAYAISVTFPMVD